MQASIVSTRGGSASHGDRGRRAADVVIAFLAAFLPLNTYWALGGTAGLGWVLGCADCTLDPAAVWVQGALLVAGIGVVAARSGIWRPALPSWLWRMGIWTMAAAFGGIGAYNLFGDNTLQARLAFAPVALALCGLCTVVARMSTPDERSAR